MSELTTERLRLRRWRDADRDAYAALNADPVVMEHFPATLSRAESDALVDRIEAGFEEHPAWGLWAVERRADGVVLGHTGLKPMPPGTPDEGGVEVGWRLARHAWGHGYATEAARAAVAHAFDEVGLDHVGSITAVVNQRSRAVMRRIGLRLVGTFEHPVLPLGHRLRPHVLHRLDRWARDVRAATADDVTALVALREQAAAWLESAGVDQWRRGEVGVDEVRTQVADGEWWVLDLDGRVVAGLRVLHADPAFWPDVDDPDHALYVHGLVVDRAWGGRGVGAALLDVAAGQAADAGRRSLRLDCAATNPRLRRHYADLGFVLRDEVQPPPPSYRVARFERDVPQDPGPGAPSAAGGRMEA